MPWWREQEALGLKVRLTAIRLFPFFFSQLPSGRKLRNVDVSKLINCLRILARLVEVLEKDPSLGVFGSKSLYIWDKYEPSYLLLECLDTLRLSLSPEPEVVAPRLDGSQRIMSSWCGAMAVIAFFFNSVCGVANEGRPVEARLHRRALAILKRDIDKSEPEMRSKPGIQRSLWFWKVFSAALSLELRSESAGVDSSTSPESLGSSDSEPWLRGEEDLNPLIVYYNDCVRKWSGIAGVSLWEDAEKALVEIAWPRLLLKKSVIESLWKRLTRSQGSSGLLSPRSQ